MGSAVCWRSPMATTSWRWCWRDVVMRARRGGLISMSLPWALQPRARQNVIAELGYFVGRLGRKRVCALRASTELSGAYVCSGSKVDMPRPSNDIRFTPEPDKFWAYEYTP